jgi:hypothetical protein
VPAVPERAARTEAEERHEWTRSATPETAGPVGGLWPWMRQGWMLVDDPADDGSTLVVRPLAELTAHLRPSRFSTFDADGGRQLARLFHLSGQTVAPVTFKP